MREMSSVGAFAESFRSSCVRQQQQQKQQPAFCRCLRTAVGSRAASSGLARFVFREVRQQQQQHVLASLLACARYSAYAAASVDVSVARSTQCGRCQRRQQTKQLVGNGCLSKMPVALLLGFSPFLYLLFSLLLSCSPWTLPLSPFVAPLAKSVLHVIYSYFCINTSIHYA